LVFVSEADHAGRGPIALFRLEQTENFLENVFEAGIFSEKYRDPS